MKDVQAGPDGDAVATALMEMFRRTGSSEAFDALVRLTRPTLLQRVRRRTRFLPPTVDPEEVLQDALVNIYRYPDRFDSRRPGAFKAWASTIVDNAVRRRLRHGQRALMVRLQPCELLAQEPDARTVDPHDQAAHAEAGERIAGAWRLFLSAYLEAFETLSDRERFVLHMVEIHGLRYADVAELIQVRAEALKMVVFRARRRLHDRMSDLLGPPEPGLVRAAG